MYAFKAPFHLLAGCCSAQVAIWCAAWARVGTKPSGRAQWRRSRRWRKYPHPAGNLQRHFDHQLIDYDGFEAADLFHEIWRLIPPLDYDPPQVIRHL